MKSTRKPTSGFNRFAKKFFYSAFVVSTFIAYAIENHGSPNGTISNVPVTANQNQTGAAANTIQSPASADTAVPTQTAAPTEAPVANDPSSGSDSSSPVQAAPATPTSVPTAAPTATSPVVSSSGYKDGTYTGSSVDIRWGYVQVQATIQGGQIANVQVLQYPTERRTSARINSFAVPELQQEAIQAQSANVNIITGATLTSEGFQQSLQAALSQAKG